MTGRRLWARRKLLALGVMLAMPVAFTLAAQIGSASGYSVATGINGEPVCNPDGADDCPE